MLTLRGMNDKYMGIDDDNLVMFQRLCFRIPYHCLHSLCKCMGRSLKVPIENMQW